MKREDNNNINNSYTNNFHFYILFIIDCIGVTFVWYIVYGMEKRETLLSVDNSNKNNDLASASSQRQSSPFSSRETNESVFGQVTTSQKQTSASSPQLVITADGGEKSGPLNNKTAFTVATDDGEEKKSQSCTASAWPQSSVRSTTFKSTLNPDAKEFRLSYTKEGSSFSLLLTAPLRSATSFTATAATPSTSLFSVSSTPTSWQQCGGVVAESGFLPANSADVSKWPQVSSHSRHSFLRDFASPAAPLTPRCIVRKVTQEYREECQQNGYHMVAVFNLEPRTSQEELLGIFFPMCAKKAKLLPSHYSPRSNRRAGVVFFPSETFASMAVEKLDNFVPNRQHQPLTVRYCNFDELDSPTEESSVSPTIYSQPQLQLQTTQENVVSCFPLPWRLPSGPKLDHIHMDMWRFVCDVMSSYPALSKNVVAVHGLDPENAQNVLAKNFLNKGADRYDMWPTKSSAFAYAAMPCVSVSALVWFKQEVTARELVALFQQKIPEGQTQPLDVVYLNSMALTNGEFLIGGSQLYDNATETGKKTTDNDKVENIDNSGISYMALINKIDAFFLREYDDPKLYLVGIHNLSATTDKKALFSLFSPHGALDAEMYPTVVNFVGESRGSGVAFFDKEVSARKAAKKLNSFVPFKQPYPVIARYLEKHSVANSMYSSGITRSVAADLAAGASGGCAVLNALILSIRERLFDVVVDAGILMETMLQIVNHSDTTMNIIQKLAFLIVEILTEMDHHAGIISTPLVNALVSLHEKLSIPRNCSKTAAANPEILDATLARNISYMQKIAQTVLNLLIDASKPHESRKVAAVISGYLFQYCYFEKSPYELAVSLIKRNEKFINSARDYMMNPPANIKPAPFLENEEDEHKPWITLMECLDLLTSLWRQHNKSRAKKDQFRGEYDRYAGEFSKGALRRAGGAGSLNTSARPTPRRVVVKVTPGTGGSGGDNGSPGLTQATPTTTVNTSVRTMGEGYPVSNIVSLDSTPAQHMVLPTTRFANETAALSASLPADGSGFIPTTQVTLQQQQQHKTKQKKEQKNQRREAAGQSSFLDVASSTESVRQTLGARAGGAPMPLAYTHSELMERTVYITKLPSNLRRAQFRRLLLHFGEFNKVRLCRDENQFQLRGGNAGASAAASAFFGEPPAGLWFSFVEFSEQNGAKAMIEYFRNLVTNSNPFSFLLTNSPEWPEASRFTQRDIRALMSVRTSPARKPIHDQLPFDALFLCSQYHPRNVLRHRPCFFGVEDGEKTFDAAVDTTTFSSTASAQLNSKDSNKTLVAETVQHNLERAVIGNENFQTDTADDDEIDLNTILDTVVSSKATNNCTSEFDERLLSRSGHVFNPVQVSWLNEFAQTAVDDEPPLPGLTFVGVEAKGDADSADATFAAERISGFDSENVWLPYASLCSTNFFGEEYFNDGEC